MIRPGATKVAAHVGSGAITRDQLADQLKQKLSDEVLEEACYQLLLEKAVLARMPDLSADGSEYRPLSDNEELTPEDVIPLDSDEFKDF